MAISSYLVNGGKYFDFRDYDDLIGIMKRRFLTDKHYAVSALGSDKTFKVAIDQLFALRNLAAHESLPAKTKAKKVLGLKYLPEPGVWIASPQKLAKLIEHLKAAANAIGKKAPY